MKKTYMIPTLQVVKIQPAQFIAASPNPGFDPEDTTGEMETRRGRFSRWEEDDEFFE